MARQRLGTLKACPKMRKLPQLDVNSFLRISKAPKKLFNCKLASFNFYHKEKLHFVY